LLTTFLAGASPVLADEPVFKPYGFIRLDIIRDDSRMQNPQFAFWVLSEDPRVREANMSSLSIHPRVSRLGVRITPKPLSEDVKVRGVVEIDFQNGGSESRETPRMRLAFFELATGDWRFLGGQDWDVLSPQFPTCHTDGILWNAGNLGDRRPQATVLYEPALGETRLRAELAVAQAGAIDAQNLDKNQLIDAVEGGRPQLQTRLGIHRPLFERNMMAGLWGHYNKTRTEISVNGQRDFESWSVGVDVALPLGPYVVVKGEAWTGRNLSDVRGGIGQGVNPFTGGEIESTGGWGEVGVRMTEFFSLFVGGSVDDPNDADVPSLDDVTGAGLSEDATGRTLNWVAFVSTRWRPWSPLLVGIEYFHWVTTYKGLDKGDNNRINLHFSYFF